MSTVFVIQKQMRFDREQRMMVPRFTTITQAEQFGTLRYVLPHTADPYDSISTLKFMEESFRDYKDGDFLLLIGNPVFIGLCSVFVSKIPDINVIRYLQWNNRYDEYAIVETVI